MWNFILFSLHLSKLSERFLFRSLWCVLHEIPGIPARISSFFFFLIELQALTSKASKCLQVIALHFYYNNNYYYNYESAVASQSSHPLSCLCSQDAQEVCRSCTDRLNQTDPRSKTKTKKQKEGKKKKNPPFFFSLTHLRERFNYNRGCMQALE